MNTSDNVTQSQPVTQPAPAVQLGCWFTDYAELLAFARILKECGAFHESTEEGEEIDALLYYFEKPWKWTGEHDKWVALGRPAAEQIPNLSDLQG